MKLLLDECVDREWKRDFLGHEVLTVADMGWRGLSNGNLLKAACEQFDALITTDRSMQYQQPIAKYEIALIVVRARSNEYQELTRLTERVLAALSTCQPRTATIISPET